MRTGIGVTLASLVLLLGSALPAGAMGGSHGQFGFRAHGGGVHHESQGHQEFHGHPGMHGRHHSFEHHAFHHHGTEVFIEGPLWWGSDWWGPSDFYYEPPVMAQQSPVYSQVEPQYYWYYCSNPPGYYPYVQQCPSPWQTVVPPATPPGQ